MKIFISLCLIFISFYISQAQQIKYNDSGFSILVDNQKDGLKYFNKEYIINENQDSIAYYPFFFAYNELSESKAVLVNESTKTTMNIESQGKIRGVKIAKVLVPANLSNFQLNINFSRKLEVKSANEQQKN